MYRETWCLGNGKITIENFLTIVADKALLVSLMDLPTSHRNPTLRVDGDLIATGGNDYFGLALNKILEREIDNPKAIEQMEY